MPVAFPVSGSTSTRTELNTVGSRSTVVKRVGSWLRNVSMTAWVSMPRMESRGPTMPTSVTKAVPLGRMRVSAVGIWVWLPMTALTRPSRYQAIAAFSLVASACMSTMITRQSPSCASASSAARKGQSGVPGQVGVDLAVVPDVVAGGDDLDPGLEQLIGCAGRQPFAAGGVFAVGDDEVDVVATPDFGEQAGEGPAPHLPHHVADDKYVHCGSHLLVRGTAAARCRRPAEWLFCVLHGAPFADDGDLDLPRVVQVLLYLLADLLRHPVGAEVIDLLRLDDDAYLAAGLDSKRLVDAREGVGHRLQRLQAIEVLGQRLPARAGTAAADRIGDDGDDRLYGGRLDLLLVRLDAVNDAGVDVVAAGGGGGGRAG